jgi:YD repeat-containing protein
MVDDIIVPLLRVDPLCGDPDADVDPRDDTDADRLSDAWERRWFGNLTTASGAPGALTDSNGDGLSDLEAWRFGLNPKVNNFTAGTVHTVLTYDPRGQLIAVTVQNQTVSFDYDAAANLLHVTPPTP